MSEEELKVIVYSDYICPFCYIGFHRIENLKKKYNIDVEWRPFEIHPETPKNGALLGDLHFSKGYIQNVMKSVERLAKEEGLTFNLTDKLPNSRYALKFSEFARKKGKFSKFHKSIFEAYWLEGKDIGDMSFLLSIIDGVGINRDEALEYVKTDESRKDLQKYTSELNILGVNGVPTYIFGDRIVVGVQPYEIFEKVIKRALKSEIV